MENNPKVSILIPVYNGDRYLRECLDSIINQDYENLQICIADDGSDEKVKEILKEYAGRDPRILIIGTRKSGVAETRNNLIEMAMGKYVLFIDADDWIEKSMVKELVSAIIKNEADISYCNFISKKALHMGHERAKTKVFSRDETMENFLVGNKVRGSLCNKLIKKKLIESKKIPGEISYGEDQYLVWEVLKKINKSVWVDCNFYFYRDNPDSLTHRSFNEAHFSCIKVSEKIYRDCKNQFPKFEKLALSNLQTAYIRLIYQAYKTNFDKEYFPFKESLSYLKTNYLKILLNKRISFTKKLFVFLNNLNGKATCSMAKRF